MGIHQKKNKERNRRLLQMLKSRVPCSDCGGNFEHYQMDFDHLRDKKMAVSKMLNYSTDTLLDEIEKCDIVCKMCHATRTYRRIKEDVRQNTNDTTTDE
jgi:hypothetical protein